MGFVKDKFLFSGVRIIGSGIILLVALFSYTPFYQSVENKLLDLGFKFRKPIPVSNQITHIDIDNKSIEMIGRWPWPRNKHCELLTVLSELGARVVVFDIDFFESSNRFLPDHKTIADAVSTSLSILLQDPPDKNISNDKYKEYIAKIGQNIYEGLWDNADIDRIFSKALKQCGNIYLTLNFPNNEIKQETAFTNSGNTFLINYLPEKHLTLKHQKYIQLPVIKNARGVGFVSIESDDDGILRHVSLVREYQQSLYPQLAFRVACDILGLYPEMINVQPGKSIHLKRENQPPITIPVDDEGQVLINWTGNYKTGWEKTFEHISYSYLTQTIFDDSVLSEEERKKEYDELLPKIKDKICIVGMIASSSTDMKPTPNAPLVPGVMLHSNLINMILTDNFIHKIPKWINLLILLLCGILVVLLASRLNPLFSAISTVIIIVACILVSFTIFSTSGIWVDLTGPLLVSFFGFASVTAYRTIREEKAKRQVKHIFGHYLAPQVINELLKNPDKLKLGGEKKQITVFFSDIANFTNISSGLVPEIMMHWINQYLSLMTDSIQNHYGMIDKYEGDAIMALFGAPMEMPDHAKLACWSALDQLKKISELNQVFKKVKLPQISIRAGINSGEMIVGNLGSEKVRSYTVMGEEVILASRLEGVNKFYQTQILISENTYQDAKEHIETREIDCIRAKGMERPVRIYELLSKKGEIDTVTKELINKYTIALEAYRSRQWDNAIDLLNACLKIKSNDGPSLRLLDQCHKLKQSPPDINWDSIHTLTSK